MTTVNAVATAITLVSIYPNDFAFHCILLLFFYFQALISDANIL